MWASRIESLDLNCTDSTSGLGMSYPTENIRIVICENRTTQWINSLLHCIATEKLTKLDGWRTPAPLFKSVSRFAPMPHCQNHNLFPVVMIKHDISAAAEFNHPLAELHRQFFNWTPTLWMLGKRLHSLPNCPDCALGCIPAFGG